MATLEQSFGFNAMCCVLLIAFFTVSVLGQTTTVSVQPEFTSVPREGDSVILRCEVLGFQSATQLLSWSAVFPDSAKILTWEGRIDSRVTDPSYTVVNNSTSDPFNIPEIHNVVINPANQSHSGTYACRVLEMRNVNNYVVVSSDQTALTVYPANIFPSCSPSGTASVLEGSSISCSVAASTRTLEVINAESSSVEVWASDTLVSGSGTQLIASVSSADDGATFNCSSVAVDFPDVSLDCQIGPLSVSSPVTTAESPSTTPPPMLPAPVSAGVVVGILLAIIIITAVIVVVALVLHRRKRRLGPIDKDREASGPARSSASPPPDQQPVANGISPPKKPAPYALSKRSPTKEPSAVYAAVQHGKGKEAARDSPGAVYASVHKDHEGTKPSPEPVQYAVVHKDPKDPKQDPEPVQYAVVHKDLKDPKENIEPVQYAAVQRGSTQDSDGHPKGDGLVYAELDLVNPPNTDKPVPKEERTVYAVLADIK